MTYPWLRFWNSTLHCPKIQRLDGETYKVWSNLLIVANEHKERGKLPSIEDTAFLLRFQVHEMSAFIEKLVEVGLIDRKGKSLAMHDWETWQEDGPKSNAQRAREWREEKKSRAHAERTPSAQANDTPSAQANASEVQESAPSAIARALPLPLVLPLPLDSEGGAGGRPPPIADPPDSPACKAVIAMGAQRWGASNGDAVVGDLLRTFPPQFVQAASDRHWDKFGANLNPGYLRGTCQSMWETGLPIPSIKDNGFHKLDPEAAKKLKNDDMNKRIAAKIKAENEAKAKANSDA